MTSKVVQDVIPPDKRSIRRIPIPSKNRVSNNEDVSREPSSDNSGGGFNGKNRGGRRSKGRGIFFDYRLWILLVVVLLILFFVLSTVFTRAEVVVVPNSQVFPVDLELTALKNSTSEGLRFDIMKISEEATKEVEGGEVREVSERASGEITIFNDHSEASQLLVENTRFETPDGLIYRIQEQVTVPGQTTDEGGNTLPGSLTVRVYADQPGEEYNVGKTDFTIPGFQGSPQFENFFARSETEMTGGFVGEARQVSEADLEEALGELRSELESELERKMQNTEIPDGFIFFRDGTFLNFADHTTDDSGDLVRINKEGSLSVVLIDRDHLNDHLVSELVPQEDREGTDIVADNLEELSFSISDREDFDPDQDQELEFSLGGQVFLVWTFNEETMKRDLAGQSKDGFQAIMRNYPSVREAHPDVRPFWRRGFPQNTERIEIEIVLDQD